MNTFDQGPLGPSRFPAPSSDALHQRAEGGERAGGVQIDQTAPAYSFPQPFNRPKRQRNLRIVARVLAGGVNVSTVALEHGICRKTAWDVVHRYCCRVDPGFYRSLAPSVVFPPGVVPFAVRPSLDVLRAHYAAFTLECYAEGLL